jgi:hypothetical protein
MSMPGFTAEAPLNYPRGYYHSAPAFTAAGGNALHPAQWPWGCNSRCVIRCQARCPSVCGSDNECLMACTEIWCYRECGCDPL